MYVYIYIIVFGYLILVIASYAWNKTSPFVLWKLKF